jgi:hypothetical protein
MLSHGGGMDTTRSRIHLIERRNFFTRLNEREYESAWWKVSEEVAEALIGGLILFHDKRDAPSFFGGRIQGYRVETEGEYRGRIVFRFEFRPDCKGIKAGREGWSLEKKITRGD